MTRRKANLEECSHNNKKNRHKNAEEFQITFQWQFLGYPLKDGTYIYGASLFQQGHYREGTKKDRQDVPAGSKSI